jgi:4-carboxymuconolactone decarboxylase
MAESETEDELNEVLIHLTGYVGVPIIREAMLVASKVFSETRGWSAVEGTK